MEKVLADKDCNIFNEIFSNEENMTNTFVKNTNNCASLASSVSSFRTNPFGALIFDCDLPDRKAMDIAVKLAVAIDKDSVNDVKYLKNKYGAEKEFSSAKEYLNRKAKEVWDVFENRDKCISVPRNSMKALGITNLPSLEFMLGDSVKYFESDGGTTTVDIIRSILTNKNLYYTIDDIYDYLLSAHKKYCCDYNLKTVTYLITILDCDVKKLSALGIEDKTIMTALQSFSLKAKLKYLFKSGLKLSMFPI